MARLSCTEIKRRYIARVERHIAAEAVSLANSDDSERPICRPTSLSISAGNLHQASLELCCAMHRIQTDPANVRKRIAEIAALAEELVTESARP